MTPDGLLVHMEKGGDFFIGQTDEKSEFHNLGFVRIVGGKAFQGIVHLQNLFIFDRRGNDGFLQLNRFLTTASFQSQFAPCIFYKYAAHRLRRGAEKMSAVLPGALMIGSETQPRLVHQCRGLERLTRKFTRHLRRRESPQLLIDQGKQLLRGFEITSLNPIKDLRHFAHSENPTEARFRTKDSTGFSTRI